MRYADPLIEKMQVSQNGDGSITISPSGEDNVLQVCGEPDQNVIVAPIPKVPAVADPAAAV